MDYSHKNLRGKSFHNVDLHNACFLGSDLRGADFSGANLYGANLSHTTMGISFRNTMLIFLVALCVSIGSGYVAMLAGQTMQTMIFSHNLNVRTAGIVAIVTTIAFILYSWWRGVGNAVKWLIIPIVTIALLIGAMAYGLGLGNGMAAIYLTAALALVVIMFVIGTAARAAANSLSPLIFTVVALSGGLFSKSVGGGIGAAVMAISCALISKRAISGAPGFDSLRKVANFVTRKFGTSFHDANLIHADLSSSEIRNADFSEADTTAARWDESKRTNCIF